MGMWGEGEEIDVIEEAGDIAGNWRQVEVMATDRNLGLEH